MKKKRLIIITLFLGLIAGGIAYKNQIRYYIYSFSEKKCCNGNNSWSVPNDQKMGLDATWENYGQEVLKHSKTFNIHPEFALALISLESSGRKQVPSRFEKHVCKRLSALKEGVISSYENLTPKDLSDASDGAIKNLASSWGPFQLMGYKCTQLGISVSQLRGDSAVYFGLKWMQANYGHLIKENRYSDSFHMHNTGRIVPKNGQFKTYDPDYIPNGLRYINYFSEKIKASTANT